MPKGTIKWFNPVRGFGFILPEDGSEPVFADCERAVVKPIEFKEGLRVDYLLLTGKKGKQAANIKVLH